MKIEITLKGSNTMVILDEELKKWIDDNTKDIDNNHKELTLCLLKSTNCLNIKNKEFILWFIKNTIDLDIIEKELTLWLIKSTDQTVSELREKMHLENGDSQHNNEIIKNNVIKNESKKFLEYISNKPIIDFLFALNSIENQFAFSELSSQLIKTKNNMLDKIVASPQFDKFNIKLTNETKSDNQYLDIICFRFFDNIPKNVLLDLQSIVKFKENFSTKYKEHKKEFDKFIKLYEIFTSDKPITEKTFLHLYSRLKNQNDLMSSLYDCVSFAKRTVAETLCSQLTHINSFKPLSNYEKSLLNIKDQDVNIINLKNHPFNLLISCSSTERYPNIYSNDKYVPKDQSSIYDATSLSFVSEQSFVTYLNAKKYITYAYFNVKPRDIIHITECDNYATYTQGDDFVSDYRFAMVKPEDLLDFSFQHGTYNEINGFLPSIIKSKNSNCENQNTINDYKSTFKNPDAIICPDTPSSLEIQFAKQLNIPILLIDKNICKTPGNPPKTNENNTYFDFSK